jgi:large subunit ribosomal protein L21
MPTQETFVYAIISDRSSQTTVRVGDVVTCDLMDAEPGSTITFDQVLLIGNEGKITLGKPLVAGAKVTAEVIGMHKGKKLIIFRFKRRKNVRRKTGHRQRYTKVRITGIEA